jgi:nucleotide-binding universal stress UspA family protein
MFKNLVVAVDGSPCSNRAFEMALQLAKAEGSTLSICSVAYRSGLDGSRKSAERAFAEMHEEAGRIVNDTTSRAKKAGIKAQGQVFEGEPVHQIVGYAKNTKAVAIVIGTHGRSGLKRFLVGSVAEGVLRSAPMPVLAVRTEARIASFGAEDRLVKILVPIDGSECSLRALDAAVEFASDLSAEIVVCNVVNLADIALSSGGEPQLLPECLTEVETKAKAILSEALARVDGRVTASSRSAEGEPVEEIEGIAAEVRPAFIVIGSHGRSGSRRAFLGNVAEGVLRVPSIPVMVVPFHEQSD